jgi:hypothetical protein
MSQTRYGLVGTAFFTSIEMVMVGQGELKKELSCYEFKKFYLHDNLMRTNFDFNNVLNLFLLFLTNFLPKNKTSHTTHPSVLIYPSSQAPSTNV